MSHILITGAGGFVGQELATSLLDSDPTVKLIITDTSAPPVPQSHASRVTSIAADLTSSSSHDAVLGFPLTAAYLLHGIMSGGSEANLELGLKVNLDSHRLLLDALRARFPGLRVIFTSSTAVFGPHGPNEQVSEKTLPMPQSSYGTEKNMIELLVNDYSRRGLLDGRVVRLPTIIIRPGAPSSAASSFASGIVRESLKGEKNTLPVRKDLEMWVCSPKVVVDNLVHAKDVPKEKFGLSRTINLPGQTVLISDILDALERVGGKQATSMVVEEKDEKTETIVENWPTRFDTSFAKSLGFKGDITLTENVRIFHTAMKKN